MPMDRSRYPQNWPEIAQQIKDEANWTCQNCGRECKRPNERRLDFIDRVVFQRLNCGCPEDHALLSEMLEKPGRFVLTVAHLDQDPGNNLPSNLKALCSVCHLQYDRRFRQYNRIAKLERLTGQGNLFLGGV